MTIDLTKIPADERAALVRVGMQYSSGETLRQAAKTLEAYGLYGKDLALCGYGAEDQAELSEWQRLLLAASAERTGARVDKRSAADDSLQWLEQGKQARLHAHAVLHQAERLLARASSETATQVGATLQKTRAAGADPQMLLDQLKVLKELLGDREVAAVLKKRGGPEAAQAVELAVVAVGKIPLNRAPGGTVPETAQMDLLDGLIVDNVRAARRAARVAARRIGRLEIEHAFELGELYRRRRTSPAAPALAGEPDKTP